MLVAEYLIAKQTNLVGWAENMKQRDSHPKSQEAFVQNRAIIVKVEIFDLKKVRPCEGKVSAMRYLSDAIYFLFVNRDEWANNVIPKAFALLWKCRYFRIHGPDFWILFISSVSV